MADPLPDPDPVVPRERLERRATALLLLLLVLVCGSIVFVLYARGAFEPTQRLVLVADDSEGVQVGMDITFAGFPIGRVRRIELGADGRAHIVVDVPTKDARWLRTTSVFTLTRGLVGGTAIRAYSGILSDPPLPDGAERMVLAGDAAAEIPRMMNEARVLVANLTALTAADGALAGTLANVQRVTGQLEQKLAGRGGAAELLLGADAAKLITLLERSNQLLARLDGLAGRADGLVGRVDGVIGRADERLLGDQGLVKDGQAVLQQVHALLADARRSLGQVDRVLQEAEGLAHNARVASVDLGTLRAEVEASLRKVEQLVNEVNRLWPLKRDTEIKLP